MIKNNANRVIINTAILYFKIIISSIISLVTVPIILKALGAADYGLYNLIGGVIALLAFLKASMTVSTQRYLSVALGQNDLNKTVYIYNTSITLHIVIGIILVLILEAFNHFLFNGFLNIEPSRIGAARIIYQFLIITLFLDVISVPFTGVINAKENMLLFSLIGIFESICKLLLALYLNTYGGDKLILYGAGILIISITVFLLNIFLVSILYKDFKLNIIRYTEKKVFKSLTGFTGWNTFGALAVVGKNQGISIILNLFYGTVINASYGVANQINGVLGYFSQTFQKSINPQLMKSQGMGNKDRLRHLVFVSSKYSVLVLAITGLPIIIEMKTILDLWLGEPPKYTLEFAQLVIFYSIVRQYSVGIMSGIQSSGNIKNYQIIMSFVIFLNVPLSYCLLKIGFPPFSCVIGFICMEIISLAIRLWMSRSILGVSSVLFLKKIIAPTLSCILISTSIAMIPHLLISSSLQRIILVVAFYVITYLVFMWYFVFDTYEKTIFLIFFKKNHNEKDC